MPDLQVKDVVVLIPGILGSVLRRDNKDVWALSPGALFRALFSLMGSVQNLTLTADPVDQDHLDDGITAHRLIQNVHLIPGLWKIDGYSGIRKALFDEFGLQPGKNYFEFPYDWRRDNRVAARMLSNQAPGWLKKWQQDSGNQNAKLVLLAHSMGGLISRYYLECLGGWKDTRSLITFGTPFFGSVNALDFIANGFQKKIGPLKIMDLTNFLRSLTSVYQLLPNHDYPCLQHADGHYSLISEADIPNLDKTRLQSAFKFHQEIDAAVETNQKDETYVRSRYLTYPIVGTRQKTLQSAQLNAGKLQAISKYKDKDEGGDGTVPRRSATPKELRPEHRELFIAGLHSGLQNGNESRNQVSGVLTSPLFDNFAFAKKVSQLVRLTMTMDDVFASSEEIRLEISSEEEGQDLAIHLQNVEEENSTDVAAVRTKADESNKVVVPRLQPGTYRIRVTGDAETIPITDVFTVMEDVT